MQWPEQPRFEIWVQHQRLGAPAAQFGGLARGCKFNCIEL
jgi:hypothetical protein